jgi:hypothetical protein
MVAVAISRYRIAKSKEHDMTTHTLPTPRATRLSAIVALAQRAWAINPLLTILTCFVICSAVLGMIGIVADPRTVLGVPTWNKTVKFSLSVLLYSSSLLVLLGRTTRRPQLLRRIGSASAVLLLLEMITLIIQGARAVPMHFNVGTPLDSAFWGFMTATISVFYLITLVGFGVLMREQLGDRVFTWAVRLGFLLAIIGMGQAFLMTGPQNDQLARLTAGEQVDFIGAHTIGAADGGAGLPFVGWSTTHGDLRIGHFVGLHGLQVLPLLALALGWVGRGQLTEGTRLRLVVLGAVGYLGLIVLLTWQALRGQPLLAPDATTLAALAALVGAVVVPGALLIVRNGASRR